MQDPIVQWVDSTSPTLLLPQVPRLVPGTRSEPDILHKDQPQPYTLEGGSISLGDQFEECNDEEGEIVCKPGFDSLSPTDKEFLLPKSLSEELTLEMKEEEIALKQPSVDTADGNVQC